MGLFGVAEVLTMAEQPVMERRSFLTEQGFEKLLPNREECAALLGLWPGDGFRVPFG